MRTSARIADFVNRILPHGWRLVRDTADAGRGSRPGLFAYLDPRTALTNLHDGQLIYVDPLDEQITPWLVAEGRWESWVERQIRRLVRPGDRVIEVGANVGYYTLIIASLIGETGQLDAFEPNPGLARLLRRSVGLSGRAAQVTVHEKVVAEQPGTAQFYVSDRYAGAGNISENGWGMGEDTRQIECEAVRLDDMFADTTVDFIRTDTEGAEILILNGAMGLLRRSPRVKLCVEWSVRMMGNRGDTHLLVNALTSLGFSFWRMEEAGLSPVAAEALLDLPDCDLLMARTLE